MWNCIFSIKDVKRPLGRGSSNPHQISAPPVNLLQTTGKTLTITGLLQYWRKTCRFSGKFWVICFLSKIMNVYSRWTSEIMRSLKSVYHTESKHKGVMEFLVRFDWGTTLRKSAFKANCMIKALRVIKCHKCVTATAAAPTANVFNKWAKSEK